MSGGARRGGIPGPESRTGLVRPAMTEAEFERRQASMPATPVGSASAPAEMNGDGIGPTIEPEPVSRATSGGSSGRASRGSRAKAVKPRRVQRMFALEEDLDKKLWLYAIHMGKDRSEVVNDLLRPIVASMVLYDSRDRRAARAADAAIDNEGEAA